MQLFKLFSEKYIFFSNLIMFIKIIFLKYLKIIKSNKKYIKRSIYTTILITKILSKLKKLNCIKITKKLSIFSTESLDNYK